MIHSGIVEIQQTTINDLPSCPGVENETMNVFDYTTQDLALSSWTWINQADSPTVKPLLPGRPRFDVLYPFKQWLDTVEIRDAQMAHKICQLIPSQCPFERDIQLLGRTILRIPPLCKLNPLYEQVVSLRFRALCYLADVCGEDVTPYC